MGAALAEQLSRLGIGISSFASVGDILDVSGADMLLWWGADESTELAVLYLESFGNARRFARTARRASAMLPILTVHAGRSAPGQRAAASHTAAAVAPLITRQALFDQAGIIATTSLGELLNAVALVASQPIPAGGTVAVVSNGGGAAVLTADACAEVGLTVAATSPATRSRLREVLPAGSALGGPVNATAAVDAEAFGAAIQIAAESADAVIAVIVRGGRPDLIPAIIAARLPVPVAAVVLDQPEAVRLLPADEPGNPVEGSVPAYAYPEAAARALARAARYGSWRARQASTVPEFGDLRAEDARSVVASFLARMPGGGWLSAEEADDLLRCYGIPMVEFTRAADADAAADAAGRLGGHVVIKADVPGLLHKSVAGAVELDLNGPARYAPRSAACRPSSPGGCPASWSSPWSSAAWRPSSAWCRSRCSARSWCSGWAGSPPMCSATGRLGWAPSPSPTPTTLFIRSARPCPASTACATSCSASPGSATAEVRQLTLTRSSPARTA